jgi:ectoine hydroxylase-related dioxygenase (phytanoyl-CoA dioxygenase family)
VANVVENKALDALVEQYLGYQIRGKDVLMWWSFASAMSPELRRARYQTIDFHFDVHALNFCYLHVYLTETDRSSGAHVLVKGSHRRKPIRWLFGSARQTDEAIATQYGDANIVTIEGPAGTAFLEDTSCYHKALAPSSHDRLMLQVRYF